MSKSQVEVSAYPADHAVRHRTGINFLLYIFLFPLCIKVLFPAPSVFTFAVGGFLFFLANTYGCYLFTLTKRHLKQDHPTTQNEKYAVLHDYRFYLDTKTIFLKNIVKFGICASCAFIVVVFFQMNILKTLMAFLALILVPLSSFFLGYLYFQLPLLLSHSYLLHHSLNVDYEQLQHEVEQLRQQPIAPPPDNFKNELAEAELLKASDTLSTYLAKIPSLDIISTLVAQYALLDDLLQLSHYEMIKLIQQETKIYAQRYKERLKNATTKEQKLEAIQKNVDDSIALGQYLRLHPEQLKQVLEREWHKQQQLQQSHLQEQVLENNTPTTINERSTPSVNHPDSFSQPEKKHSDIELLIKTLRDYITEIALIHIRPCHQMIEVLQYLEQQRRIMPLVQRLHLSKLIVQLQQHLQLDLDTYFAYPLEQRQQYQAEIKMIPNVWLKKQIEIHTQQLIENTQFVYERDLNLFTDHQKFLSQKFIPVQDFEINLNPYPLKASSKPTNLSKHVEIEDR